MTRADEIGLLFNYNENGSREMDMDLLEQLAIEKNGYEPSHELKNCWEAWNSISMFLYDLAVNQIPLEDALTNDELIELLIKFRK